MSGADTTDIISSYQEANRLWRAQCIEQSKLTDHWEAQYRLAISNLEAQWRNTSAFMRERDDALERVAQAAEDEMDRLFSIAENCAAAIFLADHGAMLPGNRAAVRALKTQSPLIRTEEEEKP